MARCRREGLQLMKNTKTVSHAPIALVLASMFGAAVAAPQPAHAAPLQVKWQAIAPRERKKLPAGLAPVEFRPRLQRADPPVFKSLEEAQEWLKERAGYPSDASAPPVPARLYGQAAARRRCCRWPELGDPDLHLRAGCV